MAEKDETGQAPKKSKMMLLIVLVVAVLALGGGGFFLYTKFMGHKADPAKVEEAAHKEKKEVAEGVGEMVVLEPFIVNLADPKGKRYLKLKISLEVEGAEVAKKTEKVVPKLRDTVIMLLTGLTFEEVMTPEGKLMIRDELTERFNQMLRPDKVKHIYFTEFMVQ